MNNAVPSTKQNYNGCVICSEQFKFWEARWTCPSNVGQTHDPFHAGCLRTWIRINPSCPIDRSPVNPNSPMDSYRINTKNMAKIALLVMIQSMRTISSSFTTSSSANNFSTTRTFRDFAAGEGWVECIGTSEDETEACKTFVKCLGEYGSPRLKVAFGLLTDTQTISRKNQMSWQGRFSDPHNTLGQCQTPEIRPQDFPMPTMWGFDLSPKCCPFIAIRYNATYPEYQTEECTQILFQPIMDEDSPTHSYVEPSTCPQIPFLTKPRLASTFLNFRNFLRGNPVEVPTLDGRVAVLQIK
jgi:hypothetical protein